MCGIIAGIHPTIYKVLLEGLLKLQNRGYDSAGISTIIDNKITISKYASGNVSALERLNNIKSQYLQSYIGIAHTRWATHGAKTDINSHPHLSYSGNFAIIHNGIIENYVTLKKKLKKNNIRCISETDSEIIAHLLELNYTKHKSVKKSIKATISELDGTWGLVIMSTIEPDTLYCTRMGSPILVGVNENVALIVSEQSAFCNYIDNYIILSNNDLCKIQKKENKITLTTEQDYLLKKINTQKKVLTPHPYKYWTEKEIYEQPISSLNAISLGGRLLSNNKVKLGGLERKQSELMQINNLILLGCGTSYFAGMFAKKNFQKLCNFDNVQIIDGAEFEACDITKNGRTAAILLSQSGETRDLYKCLKICKQHEIITIGIINVVDSLIAREVDCGCYLNAGREIGVASTKSFTSQVLLLTMVAIWFSQIHNLNLQQRIKIIQDLKKINIDIKETLDQPNIDNLLNLFKKRNSCFILGRGRGEAIAEEGALKIKEISYIHAEAYNSSSLKHGPFALLEKGFPVILIAPENKYFQKNMNTYEEIKSRYSNIIIITDRNDLNLPNAIIVKRNETFNELLCILPLQLLALKLSISKGCDVDMPRNLAKVVTVE